MSIPPATPLQFEHEEVDAPQAADCSQCRQRIASVYYETAGNLLCERCKFERESAPMGGSLGRFSRASLAGLGAAIAGSLLYFAVRELTGYEFGLIAIVVGIAVGKAVHWGSKGRGGWRYQTLAIALTYLSIVATYVPQIFKELAESDQTEEATTGTAASTPATSTAATSTVATSTVATSTTTPATPATTTVAEANVSGGEIALGLLALAVIVVAAPFLAGFQNIIGLLIISFGLFEAWKINRKTETIVTGPFRLGDRSPAAPATPA
jgi:hypothetical protein